MRKYSSGVTILTAIVLMAITFAAPVSAHHGWSEYHDEQFEITGELATAVSLAGPHGTAQIRADDKLWDIVLAGDTVTASGHRHLDESTLEIKTERLTWNGKVFNVYPDRN